MLNEHYPQPVDPEDLKVALSATENAVGSVVDIIDEELQDYELELGRAYDWVVSRTRELQLLTLSHYVLDIMSRDNRQDTAIDADNPELLALYEMPEGSYLDESPREADSAIEEGERLGTKDFLKILPPEHIIDQAVRNIYYHPWSRPVVESALERNSPSFHVLSSLDGSLYLRQPTRLPNIEITSLYPPGEDIPIRTIKVAR